MWAAIFRVFLMISFSVLYLSPWALLPSTAFTRSIIVFLLFPWFSDSWGSHVHQVYCKHVKFSEDSGVSAKTSSETCSVHYLDRVWPVALVCRCRTQPNHVNCCVHFIRCIRLPVDNVIMYGTGNYYTDTQVRIGEGRGRTEVFLSAEQMADSNNIWFQIGFLLRMGDLASWWFFFAAKYKLNFKFYFEWDI